MRTLLTRVTALLGMLAISLGILVPALALPCPHDMTAAGDACVCCDKATLASGPSCGFACQPGATANAPDAAPVLDETAAWFEISATRLAGANLPPEAPPPR